MVPFRGASQRETYRLQIVLDQLETLSFHDSHQDKKGDCVEKGTQEDAVYEPLDKGVAQV